MIIARTSALPSLVVQVQAVAFVVDDSSEEGRFHVVTRVSLIVSDVNEDQEIDAPEDPAPFDELVEKLPLELSGLGEFLSR